MPVIQIPVHSPRHLFMRVRAALAMVRDLIPAAAVDPYMYIRRRPATSCDHRRGFLNRATARTLSPWLMEVIDGSRWHTLARAALRGLAAHTGHTASVDPDH